MNVNITRILHVLSPVYIAWFYSLIYLLTLSGAITFYRNFTYWWTFLEQKVPFGRLIPSVTTTALLSQGTCFDPGYHTPTFACTYSMYIYFCNACTYAWFYFCNVFFPYGVRFVLSLENDLTVRAKTTEMTVQDFSSGSYATIFGDEVMLSCLSIHEKLLLIFH